MTLSEDSLMKRGHQLISNLSSRGVSGVAILIHASYADKVIRKYWILDRVMAIDLQFGGRILRIISVYLSHVGYQWTRFEAEKEKIIALMMKGRDQGKHILIVGDFKLSINTVDRGAYMMNLCNQSELQIRN